MRKRDVCILLGTLGVSLLLAALIFTRQILPTGSWGLSFSGGNTPPRGPATAGELAVYDGAFIGDTQEKVIYLTFDAGYENGCTGKILDILRAHQVPAAFFLAGHYLQKNPDLVARMAAEGHIVGNHTMHHYDMRKLSDEATFRAELEGIETLYRQITGKELLKFYRPPQGLYSRENLQMAKEMGYKTVFWSLAYADWDNEKQPTEQYALEKLNSRIHNGAVVLLHSTSKTNAAVLDRLLTGWKQQGYRFAPITELFSGAGN